MIDATEPTIIYCLDPNVYPLCWESWRQCQWLANLTDFEVNFLNSCLLMIGGKTESGRSVSTILYLNIKYNNTWWTDLSITPGRYGCASAIDDSKFVIVGGCESTRDEKEFKSFSEMLLCEDRHMTRKTEPDPYSAILSTYGPLRSSDHPNQDRVLRCAEIMMHTRETEWGWMEPLPFRLMNHAMAFHYGGIYVSGGQQQPGGPPLHITIEFDITVNAWVNKSDMIVPRIGHKLISYDNLLLAVGGQCFVGDEWVPVYVIEKYNVLNDDWSILTCTPNPRNCVGSALYFGRLFIVAGYKTTKAEFVTDTDIFDLFTEKWQKGPTYPSHHKPKCMVIRH